MNWENQTPHILPTERYGLDQLLRDLDAMCGDHPGKAAWEILGTSGEGRPIPLLRLGNEKAKFHCLVQGAIHAREHMNAWLLMALADDLLERGLPEGVCWYILPMMNPDGAAVSQSGTLNERQREIYEADLASGRTTEEPERYARRWKANGFGVDLNRNFPAGWEPILDPIEPASERYKGEIPFSAPETKLLRDYTLSRKFDVTLSYHSTGSVIYWEFGKRQPVNDLSRSLGEAVGAVTGYPLEGCDSLEGAGYKDWVMEDLGIPSLTIETGVGDAPLAAAEMEDIFRRNQNVLPAVAAWLEERERKKDVY